MAVTGLIPMPDTYSRMIEHSLPLHGSFADSVRLTRRTRHEWCAPRRHSFWPDRSCSGARGEVEAASYEESV